MYVCMKWSYCERERERERIGDVQKMLVVLSVSSFVNIEKLPKENILRRKEEDLSTLAAISVYLSSF